VVSLLNSKTDELGRIRNFRAGDEGDPSPYQHLSIDPADYGFVRVASQKMPTKIQGETANGQYDMWVKQ